MLAPLGKRDHAVILLELQIQLLEDKQLPSFSWFYQKTRRSELDEAASMVNWQQISSLGSVTDMWHTLRDWILNFRYSAGVELRAKIRQSSKTGLTIF